MGESFLRLEAAEQSEILRGLSPKLPRSPAVLEKDIWVCWVLRTLFSMPDRPQMAFKGGTSLSKVFNAITRFSEDVDVTIDYRGLNKSINPLADGISNTRLKKFSESLKTLARDHVQQVIAQYYLKVIASEFDAGRCTVEVSDDGEKLWIRYLTALESGGGYIEDSVLVEFGGRNITEPNEIHPIRPDIAAYVPDLDFPRADVNVLSPIRTFWEKATLIHVECHRGEFRANANRLSRHWYDLAMLADHWIGQEALNDRDLLADVIKHKKVFYNAANANYDECLAGRLRLLPDEPMLSRLREDLDRMVDAGMFIGDPPDFVWIIDRLRELETAINE